METPIDDHWKDAGRTGGAFQQSGGGAMTIAICDTLLMLTYSRSHSH